MFNKSSFKFFLILVVLFPLSGSAEILTIDEAIVSSISYHPSIKSKKSDYGAAQSDTETAKWQQWPSVSAQMQNLDKNQYGYNKNRGLTLTVEQPVFTGWKITSAIESAQSRESGVKNSINETQKDVRLKVVDAYANCVKLSQKIVYAQQNLKEHERLFGSIESRLVGGISSQADVSLANARLRQAKSDLTQLMQANKNALLTLSIITGKNIESIVMFDEELQFKNLQEALDMAQNNFPALFRLRDEIKVATADKQNKKSLLYPQISIKYENYTGLTQEINHDSSRIMLVGTFQPGAGLSASSVVESAEKKILTSQNNYETGKLDLSEKVTTQYNEAVNYFSQISDAQMYAQESENVAQSYERQYIIGKKSWLDLLNAKRESTQAHYGFVDVKTNAATAAKKLYIITSKED